MISCPLDPSERDLLVMRGKDQKGARKRSGPLWRVLSQIQGTPTAVGATMTTNENSSRSQQQPLSPVLVGLAIWLFFPLGFYLLWRHPTLRTSGKWWASGIAWACFLLFATNRSAPEADTPTQTESVEEKPAKAEKEIQQNATGANFPEKKMDELYRKAFTLRLGMSPDEVFAIMGPPTKRDFFNPADHVLPGLPVVDPRPMDTSTWSSAKDPGNSFIIVNIKEGRAVNIHAHKNRGSILDLSEAR